MTQTNNKKPNKYLLLATYLIAVVCLLLGLFLPLWGDKGILAFQLPDALNKLLNRQLIPANTGLALSYPIPLFGMGFTLDVIALIALLYAILTVFSLIALIPVIISTKKGTKAASVFMRIAETAAVIVTAIYVIIVFQIKCNSSVVLEYVGLENLSYGLVVALAGSLLALFIQNIACKGAKGIVKTIILILSIIAVVALYNVSGYFPILNNFSFAPSLFGAEEGMNADAISYATLLFNGVLKEMLSVLEFKYKIIAILCAAIAIVVILNLLIDVITLSTNTKKSGRIFNLVRYLLELVVAAVLIVMVLVCKYTIGVMLIAIAAIALIEAIITLPYIIRKPKEAKNETGDAVTQEEDANIGVEELTTVQEIQPVAEPVLMEQAESISQPEIAIQPENNVVDDDGWDEPVSMEALQDAEPTIEPEVAPVPMQSSTPVRSNVNTYSPEITTQVYTINTIYGGPVDDFMRKLTNDEKIEFAMTFIEKSKGNIGNIPDYVIGGNNRMFFSCVFIYLGRIRGLISDGLLNKMYKELNLL